MGKQKDTVMSRPRLLLLNGGTKSGRESYIEHKYPLHKVYDASEEFTEEGKAIIRQGAVDSIISGHHTVLANGFVNTDDEGAFMLIVGKPRTVEIIRINLLPAVDPIPLLCARLKVSFKH